LFFKFFFDAYFRKRFVKRFVGLVLKGEQQQLVGAPGVVLLRLDRRRRTNRRVHRASFFSGDAVEKGEEETSQGALLLLPARSCSKSFRELKARIRFLAIEESNADPSKMAYQIDFYKQNLAGYSNYPKNQRFVLVAGSRFELLISGYLTAKFRRYEPSGLILATPPRFKYAAIFL
jgi:hypothetical protein